MDFERIWRSSEHYHCSRSLAVSMRSHRAAERSAKAAEHSAEVAKESHELEKQLWQEGKQARLYIKWLQTPGAAGVPSPGKIRLRLLVRNEGRGPAFEVTAISNSGQRGAQFASLGPVVTLSYAEQTEIAFLIPDPFHRGEPFHWKVTISYRDDLGDHKLQLIHRLERPHRANITNIQALLASSLLDRVPHQQHPSNSGEWWLALPEHLEDP